jgi:hypothetical protein
MGKNVLIDDEVLYREISEYCKLNGLKINKFITNMLRKQFTIEQFGDTPFGNIVNDSPLLPISPKENIENNIDDYIEVASDGIIQPLDATKIENQEILNKENLEDDKNTDIITVNDIKEIPKIKKRRL